MVGKTPVYRGPHEGAVCSGGRKSKTGTTSKGTNSRQLATNYIHGWTGKLDWRSIIWLGLAHVGALAAPFTFSWPGLAAFLLLYFVTGCLGITLGYHRLITHRSFKTYRPLRWLLALLGGLAGEGSAVMWTAIHRKHHALSDQPGDPHSPRDGAWWSHMLWLGPHPGKSVHRALVERYAPDLLRDRAMVFLDRTFLLWHLLLGLGLYFLGHLAWGPAVGVSLVVWGMFLRLVWVLHVTWLVNSASHMWGYRNYETKDDSRNLWWVGVLAFGEGWHNNHHAFQRMARHGHKWWEIDLTYYIILLLESLGLAWDVVHRPPSRNRG